MSYENLIEQPIVWVDSSEQLERACEQWQEQTLLAVDTEFMRSRTYYPIAGLIQINDGSASYLIDPLAVDDFYPLIDIFDNPNIMKTLHSCSEDLEVFQHTFGCLPKNVLDTQIAASLCGYGFSVGFANLVNEVMDIELPKSETRSDWLQRPLSQAQRHYAAIDVEYLYTLARILIEKLNESSRIDWALADSDQMRQNFFDNQDPDRSFLRVKNAWKLNARQLLVLQKISRWREDVAQDKNIPRNRLLKESALFSIAQTSPKQLSQLRQFEGMSERMIRQNGAAVIDLIEQASQVDEVDLPDVLPAPIDKKERGLLSLMKQAVQGLAQNLGMPPEVLLRKKDYESIIVALRTQDSFVMPDSLHNWRKDLVIDTLKSCVEKYIKNEASDHEENN